MKIGEILINELIKDQEVISATIVGSYSEKKNIKTLILRLLLQRQSKEMG